MGYLFLKCSRKFVDMISHSETTRSAKLRPDDAHERRPCMVLYVMPRDIPC